ncbi:unnamed protein product, partial [Closterium sp. NIES-53]
MVTSISMRKKKTKEGGVGDEEERGLLVKEEKARGLGDIEEERSDGGMVGEEERQEKGNGLQGGMPGVVHERRKEGGLEEQGEQGGQDQGQQGEQEKQEEREERGEWEGLLRQLGQQEEQVAQGQRGFEAKQGGKGQERHEGSLDLMIVRENSPGHGGVETAQGEKGPGEGEEGAERAGGYQEQQTHADVDRGADELATHLSLHTALAQSASKESVQSNSSTSAEILASPSFRHWGHRSFDAGSFRLWLGSPGSGPSLTPSPSEHRSSEPTQQGREKDVQNQHQRQQQQQQQEHSGLSLGKAAAPSIPAAAVEEARWTRGRVAGVSLAICPVWFLAQFTFNLSLAYTSVTSNTILSCTSSLFTFALSVYLLHERFCLRKLLSVLLCVAGTAVVALADQSQASNTLNAALSNLSASGGFNSSSGGGGSSGAELSGSGNSTGLSAGGGGGGSAFDAAAVAEASAAVASNARESLLGDVLVLMSAGFYALYTTMLRSFTPAEGGFEEMGEEEGTEGGEEGVRRGGRGEEERGEEGGVESGGWGFDVAGAGSGKAEVEQEEKAGEEREIEEHKEEKGEGEKVGKGEEEGDEQKDGEGKGVRKRRDAEEEGGEEEEEEVPFSTALMFGYL